jgi:hypothetical protein
VSAVRGAAAGELTADDMLAAVDIDDKRAIPQMGKGWAAGEPERGS